MDLSTVDRGGHLEEGGHLPPIDAYRSSRPHVLESEFGRLVHKAPNAYTLIHVVVIGCARVRERMDCCSFTTSTVSRFASTCNAKASDAIENASSMPPPLPFRVISSWNKPALAFRRVDRAMETSRLSTSAIAPCDRPRCLSAPLSCLLPPGCALF